MKSLFPSPRVPKPPKPQLVQAASPAATTPLNPGTSATVGSIDSNFGRSDGAQSLISTSQRKRENTRDRRTLLGG